MRDKETEMARKKDRSRGKYAWMERAKGGNASGELTANFCAVWSSSRRDERAVLTAIAIIRERKKKQYIWGVMQDEGVRQAWVLRAHGVTGDLGEYLHLYCRQ